MKKVPFYSILIACFFVLATVAALGEEPSKSRAKRSSSISPSDVQPVYENIVALKAGLEEAEDGEEIKELLAEVADEISKIQNRLMEQARERGYPVKPENVVVAKIIGTTQICFVFHDSKKAVLEGKKPLLHLHVLIVVKDGRVVEVLAAVIPMDRKPPQKKPAIKKDFKLAVEMTREFQGISRVLFTDEAIN